MCNRNSSIQLLVFLLLLVVLGACSHEKEAAQTVTTPESKSRPEPTASSAVLSNQPTTKEPAQPQKTFISPEQEAEIAKAYYMERNRRFLNGLDLQAQWYDEAREKAMKEAEVYGPEQRAAYINSQLQIPLMRTRFVIENGPGRMEFNEKPYMLQMEPGRAGYATMRVVQIIDHSRMLVSIGSSICMAVGWNTDALVDGKTVAPDDAIVVTGTTDYVAVTGANKRVCVVEPFNLSKYTDQFRPEIPQGILNVVGDVRVGD